ncbi:MAG: MaoC family dehydratase [Gammaproteobacteria bacterium]|nr:MaoC family dehydratase [Gammaproteobacteria bacterium]MYD80474.1 MaoC family dehydratase [Gammaproteobacteria bacterium]
MSSTDSPEPFVGKELSTTRFEVTDQLLQDHYHGLELSPSSTGLLPSTIISEPDNAYFREIAYSYQQGHLWLRQQMRLLSPLRKNTTYKVSGTIEEIYPKRNRNVVHYGIKLTQPNGEIAAFSNHHQSFLSNKMTGNSVEFRKPMDKPGARKFQVPEGHGIGELTRTITREMCGIYFHGDANYHTNKESAQSLGFEDVVVGGRMTLAYTARVLEDFFGEQWWSSGELDLKFTNPVWCDDVVTVKGRLLGPHATRSEALHCFVWIEKNDGAIALVADASVLA